MSKLKEPQMRPKEKKPVKKNLWPKAKATIAILGLAAGSIRSVYLEADNRVYMIGAGILLVATLITFVLEVLFNKEGK